MIINVKDAKTNAVFTDINEGECFRYNGDYYIAAHDPDRDTEYFGVNIANGEVRDFDSFDKVLALTSEISFKEI